MAEAVGLTLLVTETDALGLGLELLELELLGLELLGLDGEGEGLPLGDVWVAVGEVEGEGWEGEAENSPHPDSSAMLAMPAEARSHRNCMKSSPFLTTCGEGPSGPGP
ncbi:MAG: hypothetical protein M0Z53_02485 [Thermaerobacter sp.]|nr:hypothetical protein [Thermaerobacter sp.]